MFAFFKNAFAVVLVDLLLIRYVEQFDLAI